MFCVGICGTCHEGTFSTQRLESNYLTMNDHSIGVA